MTAVLPAVLLGATLVLTTVAQSQVPAVPVLQNAFSNPGLAVAGNFAGGSGQSFYGAAAAWGMGGGRFQVSGAAGAQRSNGATRGAYGGRLAVSAWTSSGGALGLGAFAGLGGAPRTHTANTVTNPATLIVPAGVTVGYRRSLGRTRGISGYLSPLYRWQRLEGDTVISSGTVRVAGAIDLGISQSFGVTIGGEFGAREKSATRRGGSGTIGAAITFVPGRR